MPALTLLGVASADPRPGSDPTSLVVAGDDGALLLVDCGGCVVPRLLEAGLDPARVRSLFLTHTHPDHMSGFPLFIHGMQMLGRTEPLEVVGHEGALAAARAMMAALAIDQEERYPIRWRALDAQHPAEVETAGMGLAPFPGAHSRPVLGFRARVGGRTLAYSADTGPCAGLLAAARGVDVLVQELGKTDEREYPYHCGPSDVGEVAAAAGPGLLVLVHTALGAWPEREEALRRIRQRFTGRVDFGEPLRTYEF